MRLIDADAMIKKWRDSIGITEEDRGAVFVGYTQIPALINSLPTIDPVKHGKWEKKWHSVYHEELPCCSACGSFMAFCFDYCPNCGAHMDE